MNELREYGAVEERPFPLPQGSVGDGRQRWLGARARISILGSLIPCALLSSAVGAPAEPTPFSYQQELKILRFPELRQLQLRRRGVNITLQGLVQSRLGSPLPGLRVELQLADGGGYAASSDDRGEIRFQLSLSQLSEAPTFQFQIEGNALVAARSVRSTAEWEPLSPRLRCIPQTLYHSPEGAAPLETLQLSLALDGLSPENLGERRIVASWEGEQITTVSNPEGFFSLPLSAPFPQEVRELVVELERRPGERETRASCFIAPHQSARLQVQRISFHQPKLSLQGVSSSLLPKDQLQILIGTSAEALAALEERGEQSTDATQLHLAPLNERHFRLAFLVPPALHDEVLLFVKVIQLNEQGESRASWSAKIAPRKSQTLAQLLAQLALGALSCFLFFSLWRQGSRRKRVKPSAAPQSGVAAQSPQVLGLSPDEQLLRIRDARTHASLAGWYRVQRHFPSYPLISLEGWIPIPPEGIILTSHEQAQLQQELTGDMTLWIYSEGYLGGQVDQLASTPEMVVTLADYREALSHHFERFLHGLSLHSFGRASFMTLCVQLQERGLQQAEAQSLIKKIEAYLYDNRPLALPELTALMNLLELYQEQLLKHHSAAGSRT